MFKKCLFFVRLFNLSFILTPDRQQSKTLLTIYKCGSKIARNSVFDCHLSPVGRQMAIKISVSNYFWSTFVDSINVFWLPLIRCDLVMCKFCFLMEDLREMGQNKTHYNILRWLWFNLIMGDNFLINIRIISSCTIIVTIYSKTYNLLISILTAINNCFLNKLVETVAKSMVSTGLDKHSVWV